MTYIVVDLINNDDGASLEGYGVIVGGALMPEVFATYSSAAHAGHTETDTTPTADSYLTHLFKAGARALDQGRYEDATAIRREGSR